MSQEEITQVAPSASERVLKKLSINEKGFYYHDRLLTEMLKRKRFTESRLKNLSSPHMGAHMENRNENKALMSLRKERIVKERKTMPAIEECKPYFAALGFPLEADVFFDHFSSNGWKVGGKAPMKDWRAAARNWVRRTKTGKQTPYLTKPQQSTIQKAKEFLSEKGNDGQRNRSLVKGIPFQGI